MKDMRGMDFASKTTTAENMSTWRDFWKSFLNSQRCCTAKGRIDKKEQCYTLKYSLKK